MTHETMDVEIPERVPFCLPAEIMEAGLAGACLHQLFEGRTDAEPAATALVDGEARITYRELDQRANRLAHRLRELGAGPEMKVAVCLERTAELVAALMAVLKAGAAYVPIDPAYPRDRQAVLLTDSGATILLTQEHLLPHLPETGAVVVCIDRDREELERRSETRLAATAGPRNLAYLIYTSGSTGRPKAVAIEHRSAVARVRWSAATFSREEMAGVLGSTSVCFDMSIFEFFATLAMGGTVILAENALALPSLPSAAEVTLINTVPSAAAELARSGGIPSSVRIVNLGGEPLRAVLVERLFRFEHVEKVYNLYGPSEDTTYSTFALMRRGDPLPQQPSIGVPLDGTRAWLLDREMRQVGPGEEGELYLGGEGLSRGYLDRPDMTAQRYVPNPFAQTPGERLYTTGDLVRFLPSGEMDCLGRIDFQVKIRGFRVELGEVEAALDRAPGVADAAVVARELEGGDAVEKVLVAYVVPSPGTALDLTALRAHLQASLTEAMVPAHYVVMPELPLSPNGKVDRKALPAPDLTAVTSSYVAPRTPMEEILAGIWTEVLGLPRVGVEDDFFVLGGHSLSAIRLVARMREVLGVELPQLVLFEASTIAELAVQLDVSPEAAAAPSRSRAGLVASAAQEAMWLTERLHHELPVFTVPLVFDLVGEVDHTALRRALAEIEARHETLRIVFPEIDGRLVPTLGPVSEVELPVIDLRSLPQEVGRGEAARLIREESTQHIDIVRGPLMKASLISLAGGEHHLLLTTHHIVNDDWSTWILTRELSALYSAFAAGRPSPLPELAYQYADYAAWYQEWLEGPEAREKLAYWRRYLEGMPEVLDLPFDRPRPTVHALVGERLVAGLTSTEARRVGALARRGSGTLFMALLTGFVALIHRYTGREDLVVASPIANRVRPGTQDLIGLFTNNLPWRFDLSKSLGFTGLLGQVREALLAGVERQEVPFDRLVRELMPERNLRFPPLTQVAIGFESIRELPTELAPGISMAMREVGNGTAKLDLMLYNREERDGSVTGAWEYGTALFDAATVARMAEHFRVLLLAACENPERALTQLPLLTPSELHQSLAEWNDVRSAYPRDLCVHDLFAEWVERTPGAEALVWGDLRLTYRDLDLRSETLARYLRGLGVGPDVLVTILMERSADLVVAQLAVLKAGGAYVPLDPAYPKERLAGLLEDSRTPVVIADPHLLERIPPTTARIVPLGAGWEEDLAGSPAFGPPRALPQNLAYVMFTSGTTGRPKGVALPHGAVVRLVRNNNYGRLDPGETFLLLTAVSFDTSTLEIWGALANGGRLVVYPSHKPTLEELGDVLVRHEVTTLWLTAGLFHQMVERNLQGLRTVRQLMTGGDVVSAHHVRSVVSALPGCTVIDGYGPTENATFTSCEPVTSASRLGDSVSIGRPVANTTVLIVDRHFQPLPAGVPGELVTGGDGLSRGYLGRPDLTAERFIPDPSSGLHGELGGRVYRTGDLARWLPDGRLDFLGRIDQQVKIRGFRIELGEIEAALAIHPEVVNAVVVARLGRSGMQSDRELVGYVVPRRGGEDLAGPALRDWLRDRLPEPMIPTAWVFLDELPLNPNGKVDRRALPEPDRAVAVSEASTAPRTPTEETTAGIWMEVLGLPALGVDDNFFDLGGHSLLATQVISRLREAFGVELSLRLIFETPTVAGLASAIDLALGLGDGLTGVAIKPVPRGGPLPLSSAQRRLWFLDQLTPGLAVYNVPFPLQVTGALDAGVLRRALSEVVRRHESLRTTFVAVDGEPLQVIASPYPASLPVVDLQGLPEEARRAEAERLLEAASRRPFDLASGPLLHAALLRMAGGADGDHPEHWLLLTLHHIVADGWSIEILVREWMQIYEAFAAGRPSPLPERALQYADFATWQRRWLTSGEFASELGYWRRRLAGANSSLDLLTDHLRPAVQTYRGALIGTELPPALAGNLRDFCHREGVTVFMVALAVLDALLHRYTRQEDFSVGSVVANRNRAETEGMIGFFVNTLVLRASLAGNTSFATLLEQVRETSLEAFGHQDLPFEILVEELQPDRDLSRTPFFQTLLNVYEATVSTEPVPGLRIAPLPVTMGIAKFDLTFTMMDAAPGFSLWLEYASDLFEAPTATRLLDHFARLLEGALASPASSLLDLPLLSSTEQEQILLEWSGTEPTSEPAVCLHQLFEAQAARTPEAEALVSPDGSQRLTYRELDARAETLARRLRTLGLGPEVLAGVLMDRTVELIVAMLAVLKAGGAYVPIDPAYPRQRVAFLLESSRAAVLLTRRSILAEFAGSLPAAAVPVFLDGGAEESGEAPEAPAVQPPQPGNLAYIIYTSGSTGDPKGVAIEHRSAVAFARWARDCFSPEERAGVLGATSICFDISIMEIFVTLAWGGKILLAENALALPTLPARDEVTMINAVPSAMAELVRGGRLPDSVRTVNLGGEAVKGSLARRVYEQSQAGRVVNVYGPSEDTTYSTTAEIPRNVEVPAIGRAVTGSRAYVLDAELRPVPAGAPGAVYLAGDGLSRGYLERPDLTAERFIPSPYGEPGSRLYRVGDLARWLPSGELDFLGRIDHQVKVRGFRIELGEIEAALARHPAVLEGAVLALPEPDGIGNRLAAFVVPAGGCPPAEGLSGELRTGLKAALPEYMVPTSYVFLPALPLMPNGKLDRRALERMSREREAPVRQPVAPKTPVEEVLAGIWSDVFGHPVGLHDDFFELGGHSLLAVRVAARVRAALDVELPLQKLFAASTVTALASLLQEEMAARRGVSLIPLEQAPRGGELPLSFTQQRLWFLDRLEPGSPTFNLPSPLRLRGPLDAAALRRALEGIVARHESLRTVFAEWEGRARQIVLPETVVSLPVEDLSGLAAEDREAKAQSLANEEARLPFDLGRGPLMRTTLLRLAPEDHVLLVTQHHIVSDGWSTGVFTRELAALYEAEVTGRPASLPELPIQYSDFAAWQRRALDGEAVAGLLARFKNHFGTELPILRLPTDRPRPALQTTPGAYHSVVLPLDLMAGLHELARASGATFFMTLLAGFQALLARYSGQERIVVGTPVAGRDRDEVEHLIGFFVNTVVMPVDLSGDPTFSEALERVRDTALTAYACQDLPFDRLVKDLLPNRDRSRSPLFQVMFSFQNASGEPASSPSSLLAIESFPVETGTSQFDLTLATMETPEGLLAVVEYNTDLFNAATIERLLEHYQRLLATAVAAPSTRLSALPPAVDELPRPAAEPQAVESAAAPAEGADDRRARLAARMGKLSEAQREALEKRLRGGGA